MSFQLPVPLPPRAARRAVLAALAIVLAVAGEGGPIPAGGAAGSVPSGGTASDPSASAGGAALPEVAVRQPLFFVPNRGQWPGPARFIAMATSHRARFERGAVALWLAGTARGQEGEAAVVRLAIEGRSGSCPVEPEGRRPLPARFGFFLGNDPARHATDLRACAEVWYAGIRPGVDLRFHERDGRLEYDVLVAPGADLDGVVLRFEGGEGLEVEADGTLALRTAAGILRQPPPETWHVRRDGLREPVPCRYRLLGGGRFGFAIDGRRDEDWTLVVDPGIAWASFLGGSLWDYARTVVRDEQQRIYIGGRAESFDFPVTAGAYDTAAHGQGDIFVARMDAGGTSLEFATFIGGAGDEACQGMVYSPADATVVIAAQTFSPDLPVTAGAFDAVLGVGNGPDSDAALVKLANDGTALAACTYLGGSGFDEPYEPDLDPGGNVVVPGLTESADFPVTPGAVGTVHAGGSDAFVAVMSPDGTALVASTLLGGAGTESARCLKVLRSGDVVVAGFTDSAGFPTTAGSFAPAIAGDKDAFVARLSGALDTLVWSTFLGGSAEERAYDLAVDATDAATVVGFTDSPGFPVTPGAFDQGYNGTRDAFVARLAPDGASLLYATFLGGISFDLASTVAVDASGTATIGGETFSPDHPATPGAAMTTLASASIGGANGWVARLRPDGAALVHATFLGGSLLDWINALALDGDGGAVVVGSAWSSDFPTTPGAFDPTFNDPSFPGDDAFAASLDLLPVGAARYGTGKDCCRGPVIAGIDVTPVAGGAPVTLYTTNAPPAAAGFLLAGLVPWNPPAYLSGIPVNVDLYGPLVLLPVSADGDGYASMTFGLPAGTAGVTLCVQWFWMDTEGCAAPPGICASKGLALTIL